MGQVCEPCFQPTQVPLNQVCETYLKLIQSIQVQEQFPQRFIPETVKQKIHFLNLKIDFNHSELWKYHEPKSQNSDHSTVIYTLIHIDDIIKDGRQSQESQKMIVATSQPPLSKQQSLPKLNTLNSYHFTEAAIFKFKSNQTTDQSNPNAEVTPLNLQFQQFYFGPVNQKMNIPNATIIFKNGQYYQGNIKENSIQGQGTMTNAIGNHSYQGSWSKNKPNGHGVQILDGKFNYNGQFCNGKWNGYGKLTLLNSTNPIHFDGQFVNGILQGHGTIKNRLNETVYQGSFKNNRQHGFGKWQGPNGDKYQGYFVEGRKQGQGTFTFSSGNIYQGSFKNSRPQGQGVLIKDGISTKGHWFNGQNVLILDHNN